MSKKTCSGSALAEVAGPLKDLIDKLNGPGGKMYLEALKRFLREESPWPESGFSIWKTLRLDIVGAKATSNCSHLLHCALREGGFKIGNYVSAFLEKLVFFQGATADLVIVSVAELGFRKGAQQDQIYTRAQEFSLELCSPVVGPQLRLQYPDQPDNEQLLIAMRPISGDPGRGIFVVKRDDTGLWLDTSWVYPSFIWGAPCRWVFSRSREQH